MKNKPKIKSGARFVKTIKKKEKGDRGGAGIQIVTRVTKSQCVFS